MRLRTFNNVLVVLILLVNGYVIAAPFVPYLAFWIQGNGTKQAELTKAIHSSSAKPARSTQPDATAVPNNVVIPKLLLDQPIVEGAVKDTKQNLDKGIWRWPEGSTPDKGGNTILLGHRFSYTKPQGILYFLNKLTIGDEIGLTWNNQRYIYRVTETKVVPPTEVSILNQTEDDRLTIYTCTPLWKPVDRLVIVAERVSP